jgi:hypothetical protein
MSSTTLIGIFKTIATVRGHQVVGLLLTTIPVAERMLLYQFATAAWLMLPNRGLLAGLYPAQNPRSFFARCPEFPAN